MNIYQQAKRLEISNEIIKKLAQMFGDEYSRYARGAVYMMQFGTEVPRLKIMWDVVRRSHTTDDEALSAMRDIIRMYFRRTWDWRQKGYPHEPSIRNMYDRFNALRLDVAEEAYYREKMARMRRAETEEDILRSIQE